jgi:hypothetical protein
LSAISVDNLIAHKTRSYARKIQLSVEITHAEKIKLDYCRYLSPAPDFPRKKREYLSNRRYIY